MRAGLGLCLSPPDDACNLNATYPIRGNNLCQLYIGSLMHKCILEINTRKRSTGKKLSETFSVSEAPCSECVARCGLGRLESSVMFFSSRSSSEVCGIHIRPVASCLDRQVDNFFSSPSAFMDGGSGVKIERKLEMMASLQSKSGGPQRERS